MALSLSKDVDVGAVGRRRLAGRDAIYEKEVDALAYEPGQLRRPHCEWKDEDFYGGMECFRSPPLRLRREEFEQRDVSMDDDDNPFKPYVGCRLEAVDRQNANMCCAATVLAVRGEYLKVRLRHTEGEEDKAHAPQSTL